MEGRKNKQIDNQESNRQRKRNRLDREEIRYKIESYRSTEKKLDGKQRVIDRQRRNKIENREFRQKVKEMGQDRPELKQKQGGENR